MASSMESESNMAENGSSPTVQSRLRVLVVDDNKDTALALGIAMQRAGHTVQLAHNGVQAFQLAMKQNPDVILMDIGLPQVDGYAIVRELRNRVETKHIKIVAVTGYGLPGDIERSKAAGFDGHLLKPVDHAELCAIVNGLVSA